MILLNYAVLQTIHAQLRCVVCADCVFGGACSSVVIVDNYAVLQTIHEQLRCVEFADSVAVEVCSCVVIMFISAVLQKVCALQLRCVMFVIHSCIRRPPHNQQTQRNVALRVC